MIGILLICVYTFVYLNVACLCVVILCCVYCRSKTYVHQGPGHIFTPVVIESSGVFGTETHL